MPKQNLADLLIDVLVRAEIKRIYGVSGDSLNAITDAIRARDDFQ